jgi:hypothetical protein
MHILERYLLVALVSLLIAGCYESPRIRRYQLVAIPGYSRVHYENMLDSDDDEVRYNAICNLIEHASGYGNILKLKDSSGPSKAGAKNDISRESAERVYRAVSAGLTGRNEDIKAASLVFIAEFADRYDNHRELMELLQGVEAKDRRTQYEQLMALIALSPSGGRVDADLVTKYLGSRSWLIRSMTLLLLAENGSEGYHERLMEEYRAAGEIYDKILILEAFGKRYGPEVYALIEKELSRARSPLLRTGLIDAVQLGRYDRAVAQWILNSHATLDGDLLQDLIDGYAPIIGKLRGTEFFRILIGSNEGDLLLRRIEPYWLFTNLFKALREEKRNKYLLELEEMILDSGSLGWRWRLFQTTEGARDLLVSTEAEKIEREYGMVLRQVLIPLTEKFLQESRKRLSAETDMTDGEMAKATKEIRKILNEWEEEMEEPER